MASNWRADGTLRDYLTRNNIVAISDIDTRALTRVLRSAGGQAWRFEEIENDTWRRLPETADQITLVRE